MVLAPLYLAFVVLWALCLWQAWGFGRLGRMAARQALQPVRADVPGVSVVVACQNEAERLRRLLPLLLGQDYPAEFEVIAVDMCSTDETRALLEHFAYAYPQLRQTSLPASARDISLRRMAMTLGMKAAAHDWVVFVRPDCLPTGRDWLLAVAQSLGEDKVAAVCPVRYEPTGRTARRAQFLRLWRQMRWLPQSELGRPYSAEGCVLCYRRSHFARHRGFASSQTLQVGAETLLVNHNVPAGGCALNLRGQAQLVEEAPTARRWHEERVFCMETWRHMRHGWAIQLGYLLQVAAQGLLPLVAVGMLAVLWGNYYATASICAMWLALLALRQAMLRLTTRGLGLRAYSLSLPVLQAVAPLWEAADWCRWRLTDKRVFRKQPHPQPKPHPQPLSEERGVNSK